MHPQNRTRKEAPRQPNAGEKSPRILILRAGAIGDTLMVTPLVRALRLTFPHAYLVFLCSRSAHDVLRFNPHLDEVISLARRHIPAWLSVEKLRALRRLRELRLDWALALESHPDFLDFARRAHATHLIAYGNLPQAEGFSLAVFDPRQHSIENHLQAAQPLGARSAGLEMELYYPSRFDQAMTERLARADVPENGLLVGVHPGWGGRKHPVDQTRLRSWPAERFAEVIRWLADQADIRVVLTGSPGDRSLTAFIARLAAVPCLNVAGELSLLELAALIRRFRLYLTVDSGPAHVAAALGTPLVTLWGPGILEQTAPRGHGAPVRLLHHHVPCAPCYGTPLMKSCQDNICMKEIEVAEVRAAVEELLATPVMRRTDPIQAQCGPHPQA